MQNGTRLAAIDLGSNSFRLEIGQLDHGQIHGVEYLKEIVRQGNGLDSNRNLTLEAMHRGWDCLARFAERLSTFGTQQVRAIATQTLREAQNRDDFLKPAQEILGFPIEVISGREEARLIYQGVAHFLPQSNERRLVIDIGGRSTEIIRGQDFVAQLMESYRVGSLAWSMRYFPEGLFNSAAFHSAEVAAKAVLDEALVCFRPEDWDTALGSSGTISAIGDILEAAGGPPGKITQKGLDWLLDRLLKAQSADKLRLEAIKEDRRTVIGGGLSVLRALFDLLKIDSMDVAQGALRHGALYDTLDRENSQTDVRTASVRRLAFKFNTDKAQATRVSRTARHLYLQANAATSLVKTETNLRKLDWAAQLHEIGSRISHSDYHKHGAYILDHADALGFSVPELHRLGLLVLGHRGKLGKLRLETLDDAFIGQLLCLRLAVILCHARRDPDITPLTLSRLPDAPNAYGLQWNSEWAMSFPQSAHLLREEVTTWQKSPYLFRLTEG